MHEETKKYLEQLVIDLHLQAGKENNADLRKVADDVSDILKKERDATFRL